MKNIASSFVPLFPELKPIILEDRQAFQKYTSQFPPYSDFHFTSLWSYNTENDVKISNLNDNLVMLFRDYITKEPFYTFIGSNKPSETIKALLSETKGKKLMNMLKLIPEHSLINLHELNRQFDIAEDPDNYDYILSVDEQCDLTGNKFHAQRNHISRFNREYPRRIEIKELEGNDAEVQKDIIELFYFWEKQKDKKREDTEIELTAINRLLKDNKSFELVIIGAYDKGRMVGFTLSDAVDDEHAMLSFAKGDTDYFGIYQVLFHETAKVFKSKCIKYINIEQDLGIPGLKFSKQQWNPVRYLKKFIIKPK